MIVSQTFSARVGIVVVAILLIAGLPQTEAGRLRVRTKTYCAIPPYNYGFDTPREFERVMSLAAAESDVIYVAEQDAAARRSLVNTARNGATSAPELIATPNMTRRPALPGCFENVPIGLRVKQKRFALPQPSLSAGPAKLSRIALRLYDNGEVECTGMLDHSGGPEGFLKGGHVTVRLLGYAGVGGITATTAGAPMVWQAEQSFWVTKDRPQMVNLVPDGWHSEIADWYGEITHLEVYFEYRRSR